VRLVRRPSRVNDIVFSMHSTVTVLRVSHLHIVLFREISHTHIFRLQGNLCAPERHGESAGVQAFAVVHVQVSMSSHALSFLTGKLGKQFHFVISPLGRTLITQSTSLNAEVTWQLLLPSNSVKDKHPAFVLRLLCFKVPCRITPLLNLRSVTFGFWWNDE
jgi:hypothetical protein